MARVLQIRRGTTAQNNNFTGLPGELSFDTDAKTLRVHDGVTLGGYALARADGASTGGGDATSGAAFDINSVPAEFWTSLFAQYGTGSGFQSLTSTAVPFQNNSYLEYIFDAASPAVFARASLVCQTPDAGYNIGDVVWAFGIGNRANPTPNTFVDEDGLHACLMIGSEQFWVSHRSTGQTTNVTNSRWRAQFTVWY